MEVKGAQGLVFNERNQVLLVKRRLEKVWVIPGGHIDEGETEEQAAVREVLEETGLAVEIINKVGEYTSKIIKGKTAVYLCQILGGKFKVNGEVSDIKYWDINKLPVTLVPWHHERIMDGIKLKK